MTVKISSALLAFTLLLAASPAHAQGGGGLPAVEGWGCFVNPLRNFNLPLLSIDIRGCAETKSDKCTFLRQALGMCTFFAVNQATCEDVCQKCGNGVIDAGEDCDDNNIDTGDGCSDSCKFEPVYCCMGGGRVPLSPKEQEKLPQKPPFTGLSCEDLRDVAGPEWREITGETEIDKNIACNCGNRLIDAGETCDLGRDSAGGNLNLEEYGCDSQCNALCGDFVTHNGLDPAVPGAYVVDPNLKTDWAYGGPVGILMEVCDDGNRDGGDGCDAYCQTCGDGTVTGDEQCDLGRKADGSSYNVPNEGCTEECKFMCGNGIVDDSYVVDDGGTTWAVNDAGDYVKEACDDGNLENGDGCDWNCQQEVGACCLAPEEAEVYGIRGGLAATMDDCGTIYGGTYNDPGLVGVDPVTDEAATEFCARTAGDQFCCSAAAPFNPVKIDATKGSSCADTTEDVFKQGAFMNEATAQRACKAVYCQDQSCALHPKFACNSGYDRDWEPPANSRHLQCVNQANGENTAQKFCNYWLDPTYIEEDCYDQATLQQPAP